MRAHQPHHRIPDGLAEPADLPIFSLFERQLKPGLAIFDAQDPDIDRLGGPTINDDGLLESVQGDVAYFPLHLGDVDLLHRAPRVQKSHRKIAIV